MQKYVLLYKKVGETPLEVLSSFKNANPEFENTKLSYAGRLDPMAEGLLVCLIGEENKNRDAYLGLDKEYEVEFLSGVGTDSYDLMGLITQVQNCDVTKDSFEHAIQSFCGEFTQVYPPFSSKTVNGKPLFYWAHHGLIDMVKIPSDKRFISSIKFMSETQILVKDLSNIAISNILNVKGGFRQSEIIQNWNHVRETNSESSFKVFKYRIKCSSGTYMRQLAYDVGEKLKCPTVALSIKRTCVGKWSIEDL